MEDKQDIFDKLMQAKDDYEPDPDLPERVIEKINQREATVTFRKPLPKWVWYACAFLVTVALIVFLSVYFTRNNHKITVYTAENIEIDEIENIDNFISENELNFNYFKDVFAANRIARIKGTNTFAYVVQEFDGIGENGFDFVTLNVVLLQNAEFEFYSSYNNLDDVISIGDLSVQYYILNGVTNKINARFELDKKSYFIEIKTSDSGTAVLEKYVNQLIK